MIPGISGGSGGISQSSSDQLSSGGQLSNSKTITHNQFNTPQWPQAFGRMVDAPLPYWAEQSNNNNKTVLIGASVLAAAAVVLALIKKRG